MKPTTISSVEATFNKEKDFIYLAGPMFNEVQTKHARDIALFLRIRGYKIFAPIENEIKPKANEDNYEWADKIFKRNIEQLNCAKLVLAQLDFPLPDSHKLAMVVPSDVKNHRYYTPLNLPDAGTVWEMGCAYGRGIPVIGYALEPLVKANIMLSQSLLGFIDGKVEDVFCKDGIRWSLIVNWKGRST